MEVTLERRDEVDTCGLDCKVRPVTPKMSEASSLVTTTPTTSASEMIPSSPSSPRNATAAAIVSPIATMVGGRVIRSVVAVEASAADTALDNVSFFSCPAMIAMDFFCDDDEHYENENCHHSNDDALFGNDSLGEHERQQQHQQQQVEDTNSVDSIVRMDTTGSSEVCTIDILPEPSCDLRSSPPILTHAMIHQLLDDALPLSLKTCRWDRIYSVGRDGDTFYAMLNKCRQYKDTILVAQTTKGHIVGGYASCAWQHTQERTSWSAGSYFGTGESFLFASHPEPPSQENGDVVMKEESRQDDHDNKPFSIYKWTGANTYSQVCDVRAGRLAMGGGNAAFGLVLQDNFSRGTTGRCSTFGNPPLVPGGRFDIVSFEVYGFSSFGTTTMTRPSPSSMLMLPKLDHCSSAFRQY